MKLATVKYNTETCVAASYDDNKIILLNRLLPDTPIHSIKQIIEADEVFLDSLRQVINGISADDPAIVDFESVTWLPPIPNPGKICCVAMNNSASNARKITAPDHPAFFLKPASCLVAHGEPITIRSYYGSVHPEPELAVVIGKKSRDVLPEHAMNHVFGYSIINDITGNGMRAEDMFHYYALYPKKDNPAEVEKVEQHLSSTARYKGTDNFGAFGPWIVTRDEIDNPDNLSVTCSIADERIADDNTKYYNYKVAEIISFISYFHTLNPGDVLSMGTAFKPGATRKSIHHANFLTVGGPVSVEIEGLGKQENPIVIEDMPLGRWKLDDA
jgi:2-keto-4-pentenoate hydratase/2-oxohepta-3-ene-1,7-dioic acid hydratase in catechol pathway